MSFTARVKHEILEAIPAIVFFLIAFHVIWITRALMAAEYGVTLTGTAGATVAALIVGKVILIADKLPFVNLFPKKPLIFNVVWKTAIYLLVALLVRYIEHLVHFWRQYGDFASANRHLIDELPWPHFWAVQIWLATLLFVYCALRSAGSVPEERSTCSSEKRRRRAPPPERLQVGSNWRAAGEEGAVATGKSHDKVRGIHSPVRLLPIAHHMSMKEICVMSLGKPPSRAAHRSALPLLLAGGIIASTATAGTTHDPNRTATIFVHGFDIDGASHSGVYGDDEFEPLLDDVAGLVGLPTINQPGGAFRPNVLTATTYYGDTPPAYYTALDIADIDAVTAQWGGGIPRYAVIVAKYAVYVMERSGAQQVNFVSASMGSFVTRWLIETNAEGLAAEGKIARWLTLEGVVSGNWAASNDELVGVWELFQTPPIDVQQMHYQWIEENLHSPRTEADDPLYSGILIGQTASTHDSAFEGALTTAMLLYGEFQPNDGVQGVYDSYFQAVTAPSRLLGRPPTLSYFHVNHFELEEHQAAWAEAATFFTQRRRVTVTMTRAQVTDIHEPDLPFWDWTPAEVVFQSQIYSPEVQARWGITQPLSARHRDGASSPIRSFDENGEEQFFTHVIFDDLVLETESALELELWAEEIDWDVRYGVTEPLPRSYDALGDVCFTIPIPATPGTSAPYRVTAADWNADLVVEVFEYPFPSLGLPGDLNGDGVVNVLDVIELLLCFGQAANPPCDSADLNDDGIVNVLDLIELLLAFGTTSP